MGGLREVRAEEGGDKDGEVELLFWKYSPLFLHLSRLWVMGSLSGDRGSERRR